MIVHGAMIVHDAIIVHGVMVGHGQMILCEETHISTHPYTHWYTSHPVPPCKKPKTIQHNTTPTQHNTKQNTYNACFVDKFHCMKGRRCLGKLAKHNALGSNEVSLAILDVRVLTHVILCGVLSSTWGGCTEGCRGCLWRCVMGVYEGVGGKRYWHTWHRKRVHMWHRNRKQS